MKKSICFLILFLASLCSAGVADSNLISYYPLNEANDSNVIFDQQSATKGYLAGTPYYLLACHDANRVATEANDLYLFTSDDGKAFTLLNGGSSFHESNYLFRDPSIFKHTDGYYYIAYTNNNSVNGYDGNQIGIIKSSDLATWSKVCYIKISPATCTRTWAPEWYVDVNGLPHIFGMVKVGYGYEIYEMHPTNAGFTTWSTPVILLNPWTSGIPYPIDPYIVHTRKVGDPNYYLWIKNEDTTNIDLYVSSSLTGTYALAKPNVWLNKEGPCLIQEPNGSWMAYMQAPLGAMYWSHSIDNLETWTTPVLCTDDSASIKIGHGTVMRYGSGRWTSQHTTAGKVGTALSFNGSTDYINTQNTFQKNALTLNCWLDANDGQPSNIQKIFSRYVNSNNHFEVFLKTNGLFDANCIVGGVAKTVILYQNTGSVSALPNGLGSWIMLTAVISDCNISGTGNLLIGSSFKGSLDDVRIYNKALTGKQINAIYYGAGPPGCTNPIKSDLDNDCQVDLLDFIRLADAWAGNPPAVDLNHDGKLDFKDLAQFAIDWLACNRNPAEECWQ